MSSKKGLSIIVIIFHLATDINECQSNPCQNSGTCVDDRNMFMCLCPDGFVGPVCENGEYFSRFTNKILGKIIFWRNDYRRCDLWHHMFTKEPPSLDFLQAWFVHSSMEENIKSYILWRLHCLILINFWYDERGHISKLDRLLLS